MRLWAGVTRHLHIRWLEYVLALVLLAQAGQLLSARDLASNRIYRVLASMVHEASLARFALSLSTFWLAALLLNGHFVAFRRVSPWLRAGAALSAAMYWALWAITLKQATGPVTSVSWINHGALAFMALVCFVLSAREVAVADERAAACRRRLTS